MIHKDHRGKELIPGDKVLHVQCSYKGTGLSITEGRILAVRDGCVKVKKRGYDRPSYIYETANLIKIPDGW